MGECLGQRWAQFFGLLHAHAKDIRGLGQLRKVGIHQVGSIVHGRRKGVIAIADIDADLLQFVGDLAQVRRDKVAKRMDGFRVHRLGVGAQLQFLGIEHRVLAALRVQFVLIAGEGRGKVVLFGPNESVEKVLKSSGVDTLIPIHHELDTAIAALQ